MTIEPKPFQFTAEQQMHLDYLNEKRQRALEAYQQTEWEFQQYVSLLAKYYTAMNVNPQIIIKVNPGEIN